MLNSILIKLVSISYIFSACAFFIVSLMYIYAWFKMKRSKIIGALALFFVVSAIIRVSKGIYFEIYENSLTDTALILNILANVCLCVLILYFATVSISPDPPRRMAYQILHDIQKKIKLDKHKPKK